MQAICWKFYLEFKKKKTYFMLIVCMYVLKYIHCIHISAGACRDQRSMFDPLELELWTVLSCLMVHILKG